jgi:hypothetical protein
MSAFIPCLYCPVHVAALRLADPQSKESYLLSIRSIVQINVDGNRPEGLIRQGRRSGKPVVCWRGSVLA